MTSYAYEYKVDPRVLAARPGRPAAALMAMAVERNLRQAVERAEVRQEVLVWPSLKVTAGIGVDGLSVCVEIAAVPPHEYAAEESLHANPHALPAAELHAQLATAQMRLGDLELRHRGALGVLRASEPTPATFQAAAILSGDADRGHVPPPSAEAADPWRS